MHTPLALRGSIPGDSERLVGAHARAGPAGKWGGRFGAAQPPPRERHRTVGLGGSLSPWALAPPPRGAEICVSMPPDKTLENNMSFPPPSRAVFTVGERSLCYFHSLSPPSGCRADGKRAGRWQPSRLRAREGGHTRLPSAAEDVGAERPRSPWGWGLGVLELVPSDGTSASQSRAEDKGPSVVPWFHPFPAKWQRL